MFVQVLTRQSFVVFKKFMEKIIIYTLSDKLGVRFVGKTKNLKNRLYKHIFNAKQNGGENKRCSWIKSLLNKNELPIIDVIDEVDITEWSFWEQFWISQFKTWGFKLVNSTNGGEGTYGRIVSDKTKEKMSLTKKGKTPKNYELFRQSSIIDKVLQFDLSGKYIKEWESVGEAERVLSINNIEQVVKRKRNSAGSYIWRYKKDGLTIKELNIIKLKHEKQLKKSVSQWSINGELIKIWDSVNEVKKQYPHINAVLGGRRRTAGGYKWFYHDNIKLIN